MSIRDYQSSRIKTQTDVISPNKYKNQSRANKLKQIDAIYKSQIQQIYGVYTDKNILNSRQEKQKDDRTSFSRKTKQNDFKSNKNIKIGGIKIDDIQNISTSSRALHSVVSQQKIRSAKYVSMNWNKSLQQLKIQNQSQEIKIRDLTNKCQYLLQKLRLHISPQQFQQQIQSLSNLVQNKLQRFQNLYRIKNQQTFLQTKLQIISVLNELNIPRQQIQKGINEIQTQGSLFSFMTKKIKSELKNIKMKEQDIKFQVERDKIINQKYQEEIKYMTETNQLLKVSEQKYKLKNQSLKTQLREYLQKLRQKQILLQQSQSQIFKMKRQHQQLLNSGTKTHLLQKRLKQQQQLLLQRFQIKQKQYKHQIFSYNIERKKYQSQIQQKQGLIEQLKIRQKYLTQQNERIGRQLLRIKQRYQWCQRQIQTKRKQYDQQKQYLNSEFQKYKQNHNQSLILNAKSQTQQALRKIQQYQQAYMKIAMQLEQEKKLSQIKYQDYVKKIEWIEQEWLEKNKRLERIKEEEQEEMVKQYEEKHHQLRKEFQNKEKLLADQMQAKMKAFLAEKDKKNTQKIILIENQNQQLKKQIQQLKQFIVILQGKK